MSPSEWCIDCANTHAPERRRAILEPFGNVQPQDIYRELGELAEHLWGRRESRKGLASRKLQRDLAIVRKQNGWGAICTAPRYSAKDAARIVRLKNLGFGPTAIARALGNRSRHGITHFLHRRLGK